MPSVRPGVLAAFYFFLAFKPSEPHLSAYLEHDKHFTDAQINDDIYPVWTYSYFPLTVAVSICMLWHAVPAPPLRLIIVLGALGRLATRFLLLYCTTLLQMQVMQVTYAMGSVAEVAFVAYMFDVTPDPAHYAYVTALTQNAYLVSHVLSGVVGDVCLHALGTSVRFLFYLSAAGVAVSVVIAVTCFPRAPSVSRARRRLLLAQDLSVLRAFPTLPSFPWLLVWWMPVYTLYQFVYGYEASFYNDIQPNTSKDWNGTVLSISLLAGAITVLIPSASAVQRRLGLLPLAPTRPDSAHLRRVPATMAALAVLGGAGLAAATYLPVAPALVGLVVVFAACAPLNAMMYAEIAHVVNSLATPPCVEDGVALTAAGGVDCTPFLAADTTGDADCLAPALHDDDSAATATKTPPSRPYGAVFLLTTAVALGLQSLLQYVLFTYYSVSVVHSFRGFAAGLVALGLILGVGTAARICQRARR